MDSSPPVSGTEPINFNALNFSFKNGSNVVTYGCRKTKKLICVMEEKNVVADGRLSSPAPTSCREATIENNHILHEKLGYHKYS